MSRRPNHALRNALSELGRASTPEQLEKRGVRRIRSLSVDSISRLVEQAINRTLMERTMELDPPEVAALSADALDELLKLVEHHLDLKRRRAQIASLRAEVESELVTTGEHAQPRSPDEAAKRIEQLERRVQKLINLVEETEAALGRALRPTHLGTASIYAEVQGLEESDPNYARKQGLLRKLFEANLELRAAFGA